jgi:hypothetical protein
MRKQLRVEIEQIRHDWSHVRIVATTRRQMLDVPISGPRVEIEPLSEDQEMAIAHAQLGAAGEKIVDEAWQTPGVRELIATPLYLSALLLGGSQSASSTTKEEVLLIEPALFMTCSIISSSDFPLTHAGEAVKAVVIRFIEDHIGQKKRPGAELIG